jgi:phosphoribosylglycinamide formyltransferase-1
VINSNFIKKKGRAEVNIAVFCSGNGSNFQAIVDSVKTKLFNTNIALMVCDNPTAFAIKRAKKERIKTFIIERGNFSSKHEFESTIIEELEKENIELICLAGYMRILSSGFVEKYKNRILNIHPAILPSFKGIQGIKDALDYGVKVTGVTVHFVDKDMDSGPVILQETVKIENDDTEEVLAQKIHSVEHRLYPEAVRLFTEGKLKIKGRRVEIL